MDALIVAQGTDRLYRTTNELFCVVRCQNCGMLRLNPRPAGAELARFYPDNYWFDPDSTRVSRWAERYRRLVLLDHLGFVACAYDRAVQNGARLPILDVGCGGGLLAGLLGERGYPAIGLDSSRAACQIAWSRQRVPAVTGDLRQNPFQAGSFALVTLFHVLEHLPDPHAFLAAARELLSSDGRLIIQVPNPDSWQFRLLGPRWNGLDIPRHLHHFRPSDLRALLEKCGFGVERFKHFSWRDNPAGLAISLVPSLDPMARRIRGLRSGFLHLGAHFALAAACLPFTALEAATKHGSTIMVEARKR